MIESQLRRLLHADDAADIREIVRHVLKDNGLYKLRSCASGTEVLNCVVEFNPQMILLDFTMPQMTGSQVVRALQELDGINMDEVALVLFATASETVDINHFFRLGATDVITKPFDSTTLLDFISEIWGEFLGKKGVA